MLANDGDPAIVASVAGGAGAPGTSVSRLDEARARALQILAELQPGDHVAVLRLADHAELIAKGAIPGDRDTLRRAIENVRAAPTELDLQRALDVAASLTEDARLGQVLLITGGVADVGRVTFKPTVDVQVGLVGRGGADNQAITQLAARRTPTGEIEAFARIRNFGDQPANGVLSVSVDGQLFGEQPLTLPAGGNQELLLTELPDTARVVDARFSRPDLLALDSTATTAVHVPPLRKVLLVGSRADQLERALRAIPGVELTKLDPQQYAGRGGFDVYVFENWFPTSPPPGHWLLIDPPRNGQIVRVVDTLGRRSVGGREVNDAQIARILPNPLVSGVDLTGVTIAQAKKLTLPDWAEEAVSAREGPLIFMGYPGDYRAVVFAFGLGEANLFGRVGFPVLISNVVNWLSGDVPGSPAVASGGRFTPGDALFIQPLPRATQIQVLTPSNRRYEFEGNRPVRFVDTALPGPYVVQQFARGEEIARQVHVAAVVQPDRETALTDLRPRESLRNLLTANVTPGSGIPGPGFEQVHAEWWRLLAFVALAGLLFEWWWFHRS
jgi:hypothetical protein